MSNEPLIFVLEGDEGVNVEYRMNLGNGLKSWAALKKAGKLFKGIGTADIMEDDKKTVNQGKLLMVLLDVVLDNAGSPEFADLETIVFNNTVVNIEGSKPYKLAENKEVHFNKFRSHIFPILKNGIVYQFADFIKGNGLFKAAGLATPNS